MSYEISSSYGLEHGYYLQLCYILLDQKIISHNFDILLDIWKNRSIPEMNEIVSVDRSVRSEYRSLISLGL